MKTKYVTLTIEAENLPAVRARFASIETDTLNRFKVMGADGSIMVNMHIRGINQNEAIKMVKRKITDLDAMKV